jgi:tetratricopeptide (TPR) repeat protein
VSLTGELTKATDATRIWSKTYERDVAGMFAVQAELVREIAAELKTVVSSEATQLLARGPTDNPAAYDLFLKARAYGRKSLFDVRLRKTGKDNEDVPLNQVRESLLTSAVTLDPKFASAWAELARAQSLFFRFHSGNDRSTAARLAGARRAIEAAVALAPDAPDVLISHGYYLGILVGDYARAAAAFEKAAHLQPNSPDPLHGLGLIQRRQGKWSEALANLRRAVELDPANAEVSEELLVLLFAGRRYAEGAVEKRRALALGVLVPSDAVKYSDARSTYVHTGSTVELEKYVNSPGRLGTFGRQHEKFADAIFELVKDAKPPGPSFTGDWAFKGLHLAVMLAGKGRIADAHAVLEHAPANLRARLALDETNVSLLCDLACVEAVLGHPEEALRAVRRAVELVPTGKDHWEGPQVEENLAFVYAWTGDKTRAIETYARLLQTPHVSPRMAANTVHVMRHALWFAPLRGDPRWEALLNDPKNNAPLF